MRVLRWLLTVPGAFLGGVLVLFPLHWLITLNCRSESVDLGAAGANSIERLLTPLAFSMGFIWIGTIIAPTHKKQAALCLTALMLAFSIGFRFWAVSQLPDLVAWEPLPLVSNLVGIVSGAICAFKYVEEETPKPPGPTPIWNRRDEEPDQPAP